jgi:Holliday junction resolvase-like predicted endonuclease
MSELLAAADLLKRGFEVYRNVSFSGSSDLIIRKENVLQSVEVRTARKDSITGRIYCPKKNLRSDVLALVFKDIVTYEPEF